MNIWNPYVTSKIIGEQLCTAYAKDFGVSARNLRIFSMYGPGQDESFLLPTIVTGMCRGVLQLETSSPRRGFVYVFDVVEAIESCLTQPWTDSVAEGML